MRGKLAPIALSVGLLGLVGGVAAAQAFHAPTKSAVHLVQPAAQTVTMTPTPTATAAVAPRPVKVVKAVVAPAPVQSTQAVAPAPAPVQKAVAVSTDTSTSSPTPATTTPAPGQIARPLRPPVDPGQPTTVSEVYGGGAPSPTTTATP